MYKRQVEIFKDFGEMLDVTQAGKAPAGTLVGSGWVADNPVSYTHLTLPTSDLV